MVETVCKYFGLLIIFLRDWHEVIQAVAAVVTAISAVFAACIANRAYKNWREKIHVENIIQYLAGLNYEYNRFREKSWRFRKIYQLIYLSIKDYNHEISGEIDSNNIFEKYIYKFGTKNFQSVVDNHEKCSESLAKIITMQGVGEIYGLKKFEIFEESVDVLVTGQNKFVGLEDILKNIDMNWKVYENHTKLKEIFSEDPEIMEKRIRDALAKIHNFLHINYKKK